MSTQGRKVCRHCQQKSVCRPRGLCHTCYYAPGVRDLYPSTSKFCPREFRQGGMMGGEHDCPGNADDNSNSQPTWYVVGRLGEQRTVLSTHTDEEEARREAELLRSGGIAYAELTVEEHAHPPVARYLKEQA